MAVGAAVPLCAQGGRGGNTPPVDLTVPADLKPLLAPRRSEMRLVAVRYNADRQLLTTNYAGADSTAAPPTTVSVARIARLKRFDLSWQAALNTIDRAKLTEPATLGLDSLKQLVARNLAQLDTESATLAGAAPLMPFAPTRNARRIAHPHRTDRW
jgi:hypothetical protein